MITRKQKLDFLNTALQGNARKLAELKQALKQSETKERPYVVTIIETNEDGSHTYNRFIPFSEKWENSVETQQELAKYSEKQITEQLLEKILAGCIPKS